MFLLDFISSCLTMVLFVCSMIQSRLPEASWRPFLFTLMTGAALDGFSKTDNMSAHVSIIIMASAMSIATVSETVRLVKGSSRGE